MLETLSNLITETAIGDSKIVILTGDHGYALFDRVRKERPNQFINVGVAEQAMIGIAAGMAQQGLRPICYGLASFMPMRCLEQIKLDLCYGDLPVMLIGAGAGLVYSQLGPSHQCAEDIAVLNPLPNMRIYSPCDKWELLKCWEDVRKNKSPSYLRIGQARHPAVFRAPIPNDHFVQYSNFGTVADIALVVHGSMVHPITQIAKKLSIDCLVISRIKPFPFSPVDTSRKYIVTEEHSKHGGLYSILSSLCPNVVGICLEDKFSKKCGDHQFALSEHGMDDERLLERVKELL